MTLRAAAVACLHAHICLDLVRRSPVWACTDCGQRFAPVASDDGKAEAELERLRGIARKAGREVGPCS